MHLQLSWIPALMAGAVIGYVLACILATAKNADRRFHDAAIRAALELETTKREAYEEMNASLERHAKIERELRLGIGRMQDRQISLLEQLGASRLALIQELREKLKRQTTVTLGFAKVEGDVPSGLSVREQREALVEG